MASKRTTPWASIALIVVALVAGIVIGAVIGATVNAEDADEILATEAETERLQAAVTNAEERMWKLYREREALQAELEDAPSSQTPGREPAGTLGDGIYLVGEDIMPGEYAGRPTADVGYWARLKSTDGTVNSIIANGVVTGPLVIEVIESDRALELRGVEITLE